MRLPQILWLGGFNEGHRLRDRHPRRRVTAAVTAARIATAAIAAVEPEHMLDTAGERIERTVDRHLLIRRPTFSASATGDRPRIARLKVALAAVTEPRAATRSIDVTRRFGGDRTRGDKHCHAGGDNSDPTKRTDGTIENHRHATERA